MKLKLSTKRNTVCDRAGLGHPSLMVMHGIQTFKSDSGSKITLISSAHTKSVFGRR